MTIYVKSSGSWQAVPFPRVKNSGSYVPVLGAWVKKSGEWQRFFPGPVAASIAVIGGGGGGGRTGWNEGGGGGGAGGVVPFTTVVLNPSTTYNVTVGAGGASGYNGGYSTISGGSIGDGTSYVANTADVTLYAASYPSYCSFLNTYGVWVSSNQVDPVNSYVDVTYTSYISLQSGKNVTLTISADDYMQVTVNGTVIGSISTWQSTRSFTAYVSPGVNTIKVRALNTGGPAGFSAALIDNGVVLWNTRSPLNSPTLVKGLTAYGGGAGAYSASTGYTGQSGASGGGGTGPNNAHGGGASIYPGQGYAGGTGPWQSLGGGGGGFSGPGVRAGAGGPGVNLLGLNGWTRAVGGGGGGGASYYGYTLGAAGGIGGGGHGANSRGNFAENGADGTGGGGGGGCSVTNSGAGTSGGCGAVIVQYQSPIVLFSGGAITFNNNVATHEFNSAGTFTLAPVSG